MQLTLLDGSVAVVQLPPDARIPDWAYTPAALRSATRTDAELSLVANAEAVPADVRQEGPFAVLQVAGPLDFSLTGIMAELAGVLADAGLSLFALSTFDTDYLLVREERADAALEALRAGGHTILD